MSSSDVGGNPLADAQVVGHWGFVYDEPDERGGGVVAGEFLLRSDDVLLRRYGSSRTGQEGTRWTFQPWDIVGWWQPSRRRPDPAAAIGTLKRRGYQLHQPSPARSRSISRPPGPSRAAHPIPSTSDAPGRRSCVTNWVP
jgi:hypothetical protein